jgi:hypothetical protein
LFKAARLMRGWLAGDPLTTQLAKVAEG